MNEAGSGYGNDYASYPFKLRVSAYPSEISSGQDLIEPFFHIDIVDFHD